MNTALVKLKSVFSDPNPIVRKELLTLIRTPTYVVALFSAMILTGLAVFSAAVAQATDTSHDGTAAAGRTIFQIFFGLTFMLMTLMGSTLGALAITQEREGRTLDALTLAAMTPKQIVRGKVFAVFIAVAFVPLALLPALGVALIFGGVTLGQLLVTVFYVLLFGLLGVVAGVAQSAHADTSRRALIGTVPAAFFAALSVGGALTGLGFLAGRQTALSFSGPFSFADAYFALPFNWRYVLFLVILPGYAFGTLLWFGFASALSGVIDESDDRGRPIKRWYVGAIALGLAVLAMFVETLDAAVNDRMKTAIMVQALLTLAALLLQRILASEPLSTPARLRRHPPHALTGALFPAGLVPTTAFITVVTGMTCMLLPVMLLARKGTFASGPFLVAVWITAFIAAFGCLSGWARARFGTARASHMATALGLLVVCALVWLFAAMAGMSSGSSGNALVMLSPFWIASAAEELTRGAAGTGTSTSLSDARTWILVSTATYAILAAAFATAMLLAVRRAEERGRALVQGNNGS